MSSVHPSERFRSLARHFFRIAELHKRAESSGVTDVKSFHRDLWYAYEAIARLFYGWFKDIEPKKEVKE